MAFDDARHFSSPISMLTFGSEQYMWKSDGPNSHPNPNDPPVRSTLPAGNAITIPRASVTILRGKAQS